VAQALNVARVEAAKAMGAASIIATASGGCPGWVPAQQMLLALSTPPLADDACHTPPQAAPNPSPHPFPTPHAAPTPSPPPPPDGNARLLRKLGFVDIGETITFVDRPGVVFLALQLDL
jgi:hypothetical protein